MSVDLSAQFGRSGAAQARELGALLPPRPPRAAASEQLDDSTPAAGEVSTEAEAIPQASADDNTGSPVDDQSARRSAPSRRLQPAPAEVDQTQSFQIPVYVLPAAKAAAQQRRARDRVTNAEVAFSAIDATFPKLQQLLQSRRTVQRKAGSLFPARRQRTRGSSAEPQSRRVAWVLQATAEELGVLDSLVVELGAESRSELIAAALEADLLTKSRR
ncbi:MAG: hypothetical protein JO309_07820 [Pseudonocardiales bacterium]|nr:hypothetical protein [Pseudonocardiales bacterium]